MSYTECLAIRNGIGVREYKGDNLGQKYFPFILSLFMFIVILNGLGLFPYVFTPTVHIIITFGMSLSIIIGVSLLEFWAFRANFLSMLMPAGRRWYWRRS